MESGIRIDRQLNEAEGLVLAPTAANLEKLGLVLASVVESLGEMPGGHESSLLIMAKTRTRVIRLTGALEGALQIRLGLERRAAAGLAGYSPAGSRGETGCCPTLAATA